MQPSVATQKHKRWEIKNSIAASVGTHDIKIKWDGDDVQEVQVGAKNSEKIADDARKAHKYNLTKAQRRGVLKNEHAVQECITHIRSLLPTTSLQTQGACVSLLQKVRVLVQLYPGVVDWRLHWDGSGAGYTSVAVSPILGEQAQDLSPRNLWLVALWHAWKGDCTVSRILR